MDIYEKHGRSTQLSSGQRPPSVATLSPARVKATQPPLAGKTKGKAAGQTTEASEHSLRHSAMEAVRQRQYPWALTLLNQLIDRHPQRAAYYSNRGLVNLWCGHHSAALRDFNQAIALAPNLDQAYNNRATCYVAMDLLEKALLDYDRAVELNPFNSRARINLGVTHRDLGNFNAALTGLDDALLFYQLSEHIFAERGRTYHLRGDWNCALADYGRCLEAIAQLEPSHSLHQLAQRVQRWIDDLMLACH